MPVVIYRPILKAAGVCLKNRREALWHSSVRCFYRARISTYDAFKRLVYNFYVPKMLFIGRLDCEVSIPMHHSF